MDILIRTVRIFGFRGLENFETDLEPTTVLTGMNNAGKTSFLKALQIVLGNRQFLTLDDFYISGNVSLNKIMIDIEIIPIDAEGKQTQNFSEDWETLFTDKKIILDSSGNQLIPLRTDVTYDSLKSTFKTKQYIQKEWVQFKDDSDKYWHQTDNGIDAGFHYDEIPFFYMDAQRDILEDLKTKSSYLGKMVSKIEYSKEDIALIEEKIKELNEQAVSSSNVLENIETTLRELDSAMDNSANSVNITPFPKKIRDLNKGVTIQYSDFPMEYHGMGTRSWSSLLTLKAFIFLFEKNSIEEEMPFFSILAIEEPEAHLHPNAQKKLFNQISSINGQKIISTHSPYVAASSSIGNIRNFVKDSNSVKVGKIKLIDFATEDIRKINRQVINSRGELLFSRVVVFFEGETEEQALPILAKKYFNQVHSSLGIDFVGVGGYGNYKTFIRFADSLMIPWFIFSDAENTPDKNIKASVQTQFNESTTGKTESDYIVFLDDGNDFEQQLISDGYQDEIKKAIIAIEMPLCNGPQHEAAKMSEINAYDDETIYRILTGSKTQFGPAVAEEIVNSSKDFPSKVKSLFEKIKDTLNITE
jgi:putative ATP-dependent endonuclease of the OLD family